jgi:hypothetical protein
MRDDFEITVPQIDTLVEIVKATIGDKGGVRMTGGGLAAVSSRWCRKIWSIPYSRPLPKSMKRKPVSKRPSTSANRHRELDNVNPTTELAPDGQPWNLLTLRNDAGMSP